jgi:allantoin racemase
MRIVYLIPGPMGRTTGGTEIDRRLNILRESAEGHTEVGISDVAEGPASIESAYEEYLSIPAAVRRAVELEAEGWDAIILGCFGDPGLDAFRELVSVPVVGPGEASFLMAASLGHRFSIVTIADSIVAATERQVRNVGVGGKLASVRAVNVPVLELHQDRDRTVKLTIETGRRALEEDRADTLVLGCMTMGFLGIAAEVTRELGVPVVNPVLASLRFAEALVGSGLTHSRRAYMPPPKLVADPSRSVSDLFSAAASTGTSS